MSLGRHLLELRKRLTIAAIAVVGGAVAAWFITDPVIALLRAPIEAFADDSGHTANLNWETVTQAFDLKIQISIAIALVASSPIWLYQIWAFIVPGLLRKEKQYAIAFFASAIPLFLLGIAAGWFVMPHIIQLMLGFAPAETISNLGARYYFDFILKLLLATGIAFVLPVFLVLLNVIGILSAKAILKGWRIAILAICLFTAIATPAADLFSMFLLAIPMVVLYFAAVGIAFLHDRRVARRAAELEASIG
jgi:sec-independent protein translocase protein TatC